MTKDNSTGKNKEFYDLGKKMFDRIQPITRAVPQIPQKHSSKHMTVFELIEANGLTLHGDIEHFAELVRVDEREACAKLIEESSGTGKLVSCMSAAATIRARGNT